MLAFTVLSPEEEQGKDYHNTLRIHVLEFLDGDIVAGIL